MTEAIDLTSDPVTAAPGPVQLMLDHMRHGIALYDARQRLVASNALARRLAASPPATPDTPGWLSAARRWHGTSRGCASSPSPTAR
ncbi:hypothetical protein ACFQU2_22415 [Siccirubricoccus deserti]